MRKTGLRWAWLTGAGALLVAAIGLVTVARSARAADEGGGYLGVYTQSLTTTLREGIGYKGDGALVNRVVDGSPADKAGLRKGDVIVRYNNRLVDDASDLTDLVRDSRPGQRVSLLVHRDGSNRQINVTLGGASSDESRTRSWSWSDDDEGDDSGHGRVWIERDDDGDDDDDGDVKVYRYEGKGKEPKIFRFKDGDHDVIVPRIMGDLHGLEGLDELKDLNIEIPRMVMGRARLGVQLQDLNEGLGEYFETDKGALVTNVVDGSAADEAGFKAGDVITRFDGKDIEDSEDLMRAVRGAGEGPVDVTVVRKGRTQALRPTLEKREVQTWSWSDDRTREQLRDLSQRARERAERARERADRTRERADRVRVRERELRGQDQDVRREMERLREELRELQRKLDRMQEDEE